MVSNKAMGLSLVAAIGFFWASNNTKNIFAKFGLFLYGGVPVIKYTQPSGPCQANKAFFETKLVVYMSSNPSKSHCGIPSVEIFNILDAGLCLDTTKISIFKEVHPAVCDIFLLDALHLSVDYCYSIACQWGAGDTSSLQCITRL